MMRRKGLTLVIMLLALSAMSMAAWAETEVEVFNAGFEVLPPGVSAEEALGKVPYGWAMTRPAGTYQVGLTDEKAKSGQYSLKVDVEGSQGGIHISSKPIPVEPGKTYAALWNVFNVNEPPTYQEAIHLYMEFWGGEGWWRDVDYWSEDAWEEDLPSRWGGATRVGVFWEGKAQTFDEWFDVVVVGQAPADAKYVTVSLWTAARVMKAYVDDIRLAILD